MNHETQILGLALLAAHMLADFWLQSDRDVKRKREPLVMARHVLWVAVLSYVLAGDIGAWWIPVWMGATHLVTDGMKLLLEGRKWPGEPHLFFADQAVHVVAIGLAMVWGPLLFGYENQWMQCYGRSYAIALVGLSGLILTIWVGGIVIGLLVRRFLTELLNEPGLSEGLAAGGKVIGQLERGLIFFFVLVGRPESVALLVAAKSVFRWGELARSSRKEAEYILIGTLMSFAWGLVAAWLTACVLELI